MFHPIDRLIRPVAALCVVTGLSLFPAPVRAQGHQHGGSAGGSASALPSEGGQAAFAAIAEIVRLLEADPQTDWRTVNLEALRQHLRDMDLVTLRSTVTSAPVTGGATFVVRGTGDAIAAIKRMTAAHVSMVEMTGGPRIVRTEITDGVRLVVTARDLTDANAVARIRGLGFIGLMASGDHHQMHHLMMAKGMGHH